MGEPVTLDMSKATPIEQAVTLDMSKAQPIDSESSAPGKGQPPSDEYGSTGFENYQATSIKQLAIGAYKSLPISGSLTGFEQGPQGLSPDEMKAGMQRAVEPQNETQRAGQLIGATAQALPGVEGLIQGPGALYRAGKAAIASKMAAKTAEAIQGVVPEAAQLPAKAVTGAERIYRAAAPVGSDPGFRSNLYAAAGDLAEIGQKVNVAESAGGVIRPDMRVRATVNAINEHLSEMYQAERAPQIARNADAQLVPKFSNDANDGLKFLSRSAGGSENRNLAAQALNGGHISLKDADALARITNKELLGFESMTPAERATSSAASRRLASLKSLDQELSSNIAQELGKRGEAGITEYERRFAGLSSVRDQLQNRMNMTELQRNVPGMGAINFLRRPSIAGASQAATANVNTGRELQLGLKMLAESGIKANRPVGAGAPTVKGLLGGGNIQLPSGMEPIGQASGVTPTLDYRPSIQSPRKFVGPGEIKPAGKPRGLFDEGDIFQLDVPYPRK